MILVLVLVKYMVVVQYMTLIWERIFEIQMELHTLLLHTRHETVNRLTVKIKAYVVVLYVRS